MARVPLLLLTPVKGTELSSWDLQAEGEGGAGQNSDQKEVAYRKKNPKTWTGQEMGHWWHQQWRTKREPCGLFFRNFKHKVMESSATKSSALRGCVGP